MRHEGDPSGGDPASKVSKVSEALAIAYRIPFLLSKSISLHRECLCVRTKRNGTIQSPRTFLQETKHLSSGCTPPTPTTKAGAVSHCTPHQHRTDLLYRECGLYKNDGKQVLFRRAMQTNAHYQYYQDCQVHIFLVLVEIELVINILLVFFFNQVFTPGTCSDTPVFIFLP